MCNEAMTGYDAETQIMLRKLKWHLWIAGLYAGSANKPFMNVNQARKLYPPRICGTSIKILFRNPETVPSDNDLLYNKSDVKTSSWQM